MRIKIRSNTDEGTVFGTPVKDITYYGYNGKRNLLEAGKEIRLTYNELSDLHFFMVSHVGLSKNSADEESVESYEVAIKEIERLMVVNDNRLSEDFLELLRLKHDLKVEEWLHRTNYKGEM